MDIQALFNEFPIIETDNLILKNIEDKDIEELFSIYSNDKVFEYCGIIPKKIKTTVSNMIGHFQRDFNKKDRIKWGIYNRNKDLKLVGIIEVFNISQKVDMVTLGYFLEESSWGKGIASEAVKGMVEFLLNEIMVNRIQAEVMVENIQSKKVLLKNGFLLEGTLRQANLWSGKGIVDLEYYGLLREDYMK